MTRPISVTVEKDGQTYLCSPLDATGSLWRCGKCEKGRIRLSKNRPWEHLELTCNCCGAKYAGSKEF